MGDPVKNKALYEDRSPINFVDHIKAPLLLLAGGNDPRCPAEESQQVADAVKKRGGTVQLKIYKDEGHGFARVENQIDAYQRVVRLPEGARALAGMRLLGIRIAAIAFALRCSLFAGALFIG